MKKYYPLFVIIILAVLITSGLFVYESIHDPGDEPLATTFFSFIFMGSLISFVLYGIYALLSFLYQSIGKLMSKATTADSR